ncbi:MAG: dual specificity protein phosphatase family protein, partial [Planctomycetota bacterium]|nr:dual specificity protein phosphatase family protein [Planctomycetota bacterium]
MVGTLAWSYVALSLLAAAGAYGGLGPGVYMKRKGRLNPLSWILLAPLHGILRLMNWVVADFGREHAHDEIVPGLYLGRALSHRAAAREAFGAVLDLTAELDEARPFLDGRPYLCIPLLDGTAPSPEQMQQGVDFIEENLEHGTVYVHCAVGHRRSAVLVAGYLMRSDQVDGAAEAEALLRNLRPRVRFHAAQRRALEALEEREPPLLVFDGDCGFCRRWVERWKRETGDRVAYTPYQEVGDRFPGIAPA